MNILSLHLTSSIHWGSLHYSILHIFKIVKILKKGSWIYKKMTNNETNFTTGEYKQKFLQHLNIMMKLQ